MDANDIPEEMINDPEFNQILSSALRARNASLLKAHADIDKQIELEKKTVCKQYADREGWKKDLKYLKEQNSILRETIARQTREIDEQKYQIVLLDKKLDDASLRAKEVHAKFLANAQTAQKTWEAYKEEYEAFPLAIARKKMESEYYKRKVECQVMQYKKTEFLKMLQCREKIYKMQTRAACVSFAQTVIKLWAIQREQLTLENIVKNKNTELETISAQCENLQRKLEEKAKIEALARQQMPPPKLNISLMESLYVCKSNEEFESSRGISKSYKRIPEPDTVSIDTVMFAEIYAQEKHSAMETDSAMDDDEQSRTVSIDTVMFPETYAQEKHSAMETESAIDDDEQSLYSASICAPINPDSKPILSQESQKMNINPLERVHSRMSCDTVLCGDHNESQSVAEDSYEPEQALQVLESPSKPASQQELIKQSSTRQLSNTSVNEPVKNTSTSRATASSGAASGINVENPSSAQAKGVPKITSIETVRRPYNIQSQPLPQPIISPTLSSMTSYSGRHYAASSDSNGSLSRVYNLIDKGSPAFTEFTDSSAMDLPSNWQTLSPCPSFVSSIASTRTVTADEQNPAEQKPAGSQDTGSNFLFNYFKTNKPSDRQLF